MTPTVCVFNRTRESFLCLSAVAAGLDPCSRAGREDGVWLTPAPRAYTVGKFCPVDLLYLDRRNRVVQMVEHLDPLQIVPVRWRYSSVLEVRVRTIHSSRTCIGDQLLICAPEEVETHWKEIQVERAWIKQEVIPCSSG